MEAIMARTKPGAEFDPAFADRLRGRLLSALDEGAKRKAPSGLHRPAWFSFPRAALAGLAVLVIALGAIAVMTLPGLEGASPESQSGPMALLGSANIVRVGDRAFGTFVSSGAASDAASGGAVPAAQEPSAVPAMTPKMMSVAAMPPSVVPPAAPVYRYGGGAFVQSHASLDVLKVLPEAIPADAAARALAQTGFGDASMTEATLSEHRPFGYTIQLDLQGGSISISENSDEWPQAEAGPSPMATSTAISIANRFLEDHGIATGRYGTPEIRSNASIVAPIAEMPMIPYHPDTIEVLYPLVVNGMGVYSESGTQIGMTVTVSARYGRVTSVYGLNAEYYEASAYDAITSTSTILSLAEHASVRPIIYNGLQSAAADAATDAPSSIAGTLGTPVLAYAQIFKTAPDGTAEQFLVPAYAFPVSGGVSGRNIIVPLISDFAPSS